jgi:phosphoribosylformimino-5-aminoimidazole carboxamide ribonucleotide (ProFAR) isomerase
MKVLFLDHDGVICLAPQWGKRNSKNSKKKGEFFDPFCNKAINVLNEIIEETDCEIVVSSDWRTYKSLDYMKSLYIERGIIKPPMDYTNIFSINDEDILEETWEYKDRNQTLARVREKEIKHWLSKNDVEAWVAVDDLNMKKLKNFVHTPSAYEGIKQIGKKDKIINILNRK